MKKLLLIAIVLATCYTTVSAQFAGIVYKPAEKKTMLLASNFIYEMHTSDSKLGATSATGYNLQGIYILKNQWEINGSLSMSIASFIENKEANTKNRVLELGVMSMPFHSKIKKKDRSSFTVQQANVNYIFRGKYEYRKISTLHGRIGINHNKNYFPSNMNLKDYNSIEVPFMHNRANYYINEETFAFNSIYIGIANKQTSIAYHVWNNSLAEISNHFYVYADLIFMPTIKKEWEYLNIYNKNIITVNTFELPEAKYSYSSLGYRLGFKFFTNNSRSYDYFIGLEIGKHPSIYSTSDKNGGFIIQATTGFSIAK